MFRKKLVLLAVAVLCSLQIVTPAYAAEKNVSFDAVYSQSFFAGPKEGAEEKDTEEENQDEDNSQPSDEESSEADDQPAPPLPDPEATAPTEDEQPTDDEWPEDGFVPVEGEMPDDDVPVPNENGFEQQDETDIEDEVDEYIPNVADDSSDNSGTTIIACVAIIGVVIVIVTIIIAITITKKRNGGQQYGYSVPYNQQPMNDYAYQPQQVVNNVGASAESQFAPPVNEGPSVMISLEMLQGACNNNSFALTKVVSLGSDPSCGVVFANSAVEAVHAKLELRGNEVFLVDASESGTYLEGMRISLQNKLDSGDTVSIGNVEFIVRF